jgi:elongator complex protein 5
MRSSPYVISLVKKDATQSSGAILYDPDSADDIDDDDPDEDLDI